MITMLDLIKAMEMEGGATDLMIKVRNGVMSSRLLDIEWTTLAEATIPTNMDDVDIPIVNIDKVKDLLKRFGSDAQIIIKNNKLIASEGTKRGWVNLGNSASIESHERFVGKSDAFDKQEQILKEDKNKEWYKLKVSIATLKKILKDTEAVDSTFVEFIIEDGMLKFRSEGQDSGFERDLGKDVTGELKAMFKVPFHRVISTTFETEVHLFIRTNTPLYIKGEHSRYIIAPVIIEK